MTIMRFCQHIFGDFGANIVIGIVDSEGSRGIDKLSVFDIFLPNDLIPLVFKIVVVFELPKGVLALDKEQVHL